MQISTILVALSAAVLLSTSVAAQTSRSASPQPSAPNPEFQPTTCQIGSESCTPRGGSFFTDQAAFEAAIDPTFYDEGFDGVASGSAVSLDFSDGTFGYTITAFGDESNLLFNEPGIISTDSALNSLLVSFTGDPVLAVGGTFFASDINFSPTGSAIVLTLDDGTTQVISVSSASTFGGFVAGAPIISIAIEAPDGESPEWPTINNLIVGTVTGGPPNPLPSSVPVPTNSFYGLLIMMLAMLTLGVFIMNKRSV